MTDISELVALLGLEPHVEGGWFRQTVTCVVAPGFDFADFTLA